MSSSGAVFHRLVLILAFISGANFRIRAVGQESEMQKPSADARSTLPLYFNVEPKSVTVYANESVSLFCSAYPPDSEIRWTLNGTDIVSDNHHVIEDGLLRLSPVWSSDWQNFEDRVYRCIASSSAGTVLSREALVSITRLEPFSDSVPNQNVSVFNGSTAVIVCSIPDSNPRAVIEIEKNGRPLRIGERQKILPSGNLQIVRTVRKDEGVYRCVAVNPLSSERQIAPYTAQLRVISPNAPAVSLRFVWTPPSAVEVISGRNVTLECAADGWPVPRIMWYKRTDRGTLTHLAISNAGSGGQKYTQVFGNLVIANVQTSDDGTYFCQAVTEGQPSINTTVSLEVLEPPIITVPPVDQNITEGVNTTLYCAFEGNPVPDVQWFHNAVPVVDSERRHITGIGLDIINADVSATGMYQCFAINTAGVRSASARLVVSPLTTTAAPTTTVPTTASRSELPDRQQILPADSLIRPVSQRPGRGRTKPAMTSSSATSPTTPFVNEDDDDDDGAFDEQFTVGLADEELQAGEDSIPDTTGNVGLQSRNLEVPPLPGVTQQTERSVLLHWTGGMASNSSSVQVVFYKVQYQEVSTGNGDRGGKKSRWQTVDGEISPSRQQFEVRDLKQGSTYQFRLVAAYSNHDNQHGPISARFTLSPPSNPGAPRSPSGLLTIVEAQPSNSSISIKWQYSPTDRTPVVGFYVFYKPYYASDDNYRRHVVSNSKSRRVEITGLNAGTSYSFRMQSYNNAGESDFSNTVVRKTLGESNECDDGMCSVPLPADRMRASTTSHRNAVVPKTQGDGSECEDGLCSVPSGVDVQMSTTSHRNSLYVPNRLSTQSSNELLFVVLGIVLGSTLVTLLGIMFACACQQRRRARMLAVRRGETKFHDPARQIYLNSLSSKNKSLNGSGSSGFLLKNIDAGTGTGTGTGNRLAANGGFYEQRSSTGRWSSSLGGHAASDSREHNPDHISSAEPVIVAQQVYGVESAKPPPGSSAGSGNTSKASNYSLKKAENSSSGNNVSDIQLVEKTPDPGLIQRPREMASSSSSHLTSSRSATRTTTGGTGCSDAGSRQSSSLNRERRTSPDHIPRLHECWSLEPVRRANNRSATGGSRGTTEPSSELSSMDSLPLSAGNKPPSLGAGRGSTGLSTVDDSGSPVMSKFNDNNDVCSPTNRDLRMQSHITTEVLSAEISELIAEGDSLLGDRRND